MRAKYFFIYIAAGIAFLAVSAWVFLTNGKNAKALRAKYKLGGLLLTCTAMLSVASCGQIPHPGVTCYDAEIMCYDPYVEEKDIVDLYFKDEHGIYGLEGREISPGDLISVSIANPSHDNYVLKILTSDTERTELQSSEIIIPEDGSYFEVPLSADVEYKGEALVEVHGVMPEDSESLSATLGIALVTII